MLTNNRCPVCHLLEPHECLDPRVVIRQGSVAYECQTRGEGKDREYAAWARHQRKPRGPNKAAPRVVGA